MQTCVYDFCRRTRNTTYQHDSESDLDYAMARYYASRSGRFMTPDPGHVGASLDDPQSWNAYAYSRNDPVNLTDPSGLDYEVCFLVFASTECNTLSDDSYDLYFSFFIQRLELPSPGSLADGEGGGFACNNSSSGGLVNGQIEVFVQLILNCGTVRYFTPGGGNGSPGDQVGGEGGAKDYEDPYDPLISRFVGIASGSAIAHTGFVGVTIEPIGIATSLFGKTVVPKTICARIGPGIFFGVGANLGGGIVRKDARSLAGLSFGLAGDVAVGQGVGGQVNLGVSKSGPTSLTGSAGYKGAGIGIAVAAQVCYTSLAPYSEIKNGVFQD